MAKKKEPDKLDKLLDALTEDATAEEILKDGSILKELQKRFIERALEAEMTDHLGYEKNSPDGKNTGNSRNGRSSKTVAAPNGELDISTPRDRNGTFDPQLVRKRQVRLQGFDEKVIAFYSRGMTTREIQEQLLEVYGTEVSPSLISKVTDAVLDEAKTWQNRPLDAVYPVVYLDAIHMKIRTSGRVTNRAVYLALGINLEGNKELLGLWIGEAEGAKFWLGILNELQNRGVQDILIAAVDGRHRKRVPPDRDPALHRAHDPQLPALRGLEGAEGCGQGAEDDLHGPDRRSRWAGPGRVRGYVRRAIPDGRQDLA